MPTFAKCARVRALMDYLAERVAAERPLLEGERPQPG